MSTQSKRQMTLLGWKRVTDHSHRDGARDTPPKKQKPKEAPNWVNKSLPNGPMLLLQSTIGGHDPLERKLVRDALISLPDWNDNVTFHIFGKECRMRRRICQYSTGGKITYSYSGVTNMEAPDFPDIVHRIKCQVEELMLHHLLLHESVTTTNKEHLVIPMDFLDALRTIQQSNRTGKRPEIFNYCLLNHYRNGEEYMSYHTDDESSLHPQYPIASVSFGSTRNFDIRLRRKDDTGKRSRLERIPLGDGDVLIMFPPMQTYYEHGVPVQKLVDGERLNLTFRRVGCV